MRSPEMRELDDLFAEAATKGREVYLRATRRVLAQCPSLDYLIDAMGAQFFVRTDGKTIDDNDLPKTAKAFLDGVASRHLELFGSLGWQIYRDHTVEDW